MQMSWMAALASLAVLSGCATAQDMDHGAMSHEEMMRHCQMMEQHEGGQAGHDATNHDPAEHGGMSHEDMMRHCAEMRAGAPAPQY
jgi:hypothetical protein